MSFEPHFGSHKGANIQKILSIILSLAVICIALTVQAEHSQFSNKNDSFKQWQERFRLQALAHGISTSVFDQEIIPLTPDPGILKFDSTQPEFTRTIWQYLDNAISLKRIKLGKELLKKHHQLFDRIEKEYGVQREIIVAIWAMESDFGRNYGDKEVLRSLATLAYHGKRSAFAQEELLAALQIIQTGKIISKELIGSWAGAMGQPQFMPSSYLKYAVDQNRDGKIDLWKSLPDVFASIANFLAESGWRADEDWGVEVKIPKDFDWRLNSSAYQLRFIQWKSLGVHSINGKPFKSIQRLASFFIPAGRYGPLFLVTHNFDVIKRYNKSSSYALAVAQLSRLLAGGESFHIAWPRDEKALTRKQIEEMQTRLTLAGHSLGKVDGKIGTKTREAIRTWQLEQGYAGDGYANNELLEHLRKK